MVEEVYIYLQESGKKTGPRNKAKVDTFRRFAEAHGFHPTCVYLDKRFVKPDRPGFQRMLAALMEGRAVGWIHSVRGMGRSGRPGFFVGGKFQNDRLPCSLVPLRSKITGS